MLKGEGSEADNDYVAKQYQKVESGKATGEEAADLFSTMKVDPLMGLDSRNSFMLRSAFKGKDFWSIDLKRMKATNDAIGMKNADYWLNKVGNIIRKSKPDFVNSVRWGGDEITFDTNGKPITPSQAKEMNVYMGKLMDTIREKSPFDARWTYGKSIYEAVEKTNTAKKAEGRAALPRDFDPQKWMKFAKEKGDPAAVAEQLDEAEIVPAQKKTRTKTTVKPKDDGSFEMTTEKEDIPEGPVSPERQKYLEAFAEREPETPRAEFQNATWNTGNIIDYLTASGSKLSRPELVKQARGIYAKYARSGRWDSLFKKRGGGGPAAPPAAPPAPAPGTGLPPAPARGMAQREIARPRAAQSEIPEGKIDRVAEATDAINVWKNSARDNADALARAKKAGDPDVGEYKERLSQAKNQIAAWESKLVKAKSDAAKAAPLATTVKAEAKKGAATRAREAVPFEEIPEEGAVEEASGIKPAVERFGHADDAVPGGMPEKFEKPKARDVWARGKARLKITKPDVDEPWRVAVKYEDGNAETTSLYDLWDNGWRPLGYRGAKDAIGYKTPPRRIVDVAAETLEGVKPASVTRRSSGEVLDRVRQRESARINTGFNTPKVEGQRVRSGLGLPTESEAVPERPFGPGKVIKAGTALEEVPEYGRSFEELYNEILADSRYEPEAENFYDYMQNTIDRSLAIGRRYPEGTRFEGVPIQSNVLEDMRGRTIEHFVKFFDPTKSKESSLKQAVENYTRRWIGKELGRVAVEEGEFEQLAEGAPGAEEIPEGRIGGIEDFPEEASVFGGSTVSNPEEIMLRNLLQTDASTTGRQDRVNNAFKDVLASIPKSSIPVYKKWLNDVEFGEGFADKASWKGQAGIRKMAEEMGLSKSDFGRKVVEIRKAFEERFQNDPELRKEFVDGAVKQQDFWTMLDKQRRQIRAAMIEKLPEIDPGRQAFDVPEKVVPEVVQKIGEIRNVPDIPGVRNKVEPRLLRGMEPVERQRWEDWLREHPDKEGDAADQLRITTPMLKVDVPEANKFMEPGTFDGFKFAFGEMMKPKDGIVAFPEFFELSDTIENIFGSKAFKDFAERTGDRFTRSWQTGYLRGARDMIRQPYWSEKFHNYTNKLLEVEGHASGITERLFKMTKPFYRMTDTQKDNIWKVMEFEDATESLVTEPGSKAQLKMREAGIKLTPEEKSGYRMMRQAFDHIVLNEMPKLMRRAGFKQEQISYIIDTHYRKGYLPHFRYGDYVLSYLAPVEGEEGRRYRRFVESFDLPSERDARREEIAKSYTLSSGARRKVRFEEFQFSKIKVDPNSFIMLLENWPVAEKMFEKVKVTPGESQAIDIVKRMAKDSIMGNFAKGRLAQRRGRMGWSTDYERAVKDYFMHVPFSLTRRYLRGEIEGEIAKMDSVDQAAARDQYDFWSGASNKEGKGTMRVRKVIYDYYLMLKPSFMLQNLTQRLSANLPLAIAEAQMVRGEGGESAGMKASLVGQTKEIGIYVDGMKRVAAGKDTSLDAIIKDSKHFTDTEKKVLSRLYLEDELGASRTQENVGKSAAGIRMSQTGPGRYLPNIEIFGTLSEKSNRIHSALTALEIYKNEGMGPKELYDKTVNFIRRANFPYSKATRQKIARGPIGSPMFVFKSYLQNWMFGLMPYLYNNSKPAFAASAAIFAGLAGAAGLPAYQGIRWLAKQVIPGKDDTEKEQKLIAIEDAIDSKFAGVLMHGIPAIFGADGSSWFGFPDMGSLVPVTMSDNFNNNLVKAWLDDSIDSEEKWTRLMPAYIKHWMRMHRMNQTGAISTDRYGAPTMTAQDVNRMSGEIKDWAFKELGKLPTPEDIGDLERAMYTVMGTPSLTASRYYKKVQDIKKISEGVKKEKGEMNRVVGQMFTRNVDPALADEIWGMSESEFRDSFWDIVDMWPAEQQKELDDYVTEATKGGKAFDLGSILGVMQERIKEIRTRGKR